MHTFTCKGVEDLFDSEFVHVANGEPHQYHPPGQQNVAPGPGASGKTLDEPHINDDN